MIERPVPKIGDTIKARFENFLGQVIVVTGIVRRIDSSSTIVGNDIDAEFDASEEQSHD